MHTDDITGRRFGHLVAIAAAGQYVTPSGYVRRLWLFACDCGRTVEKLKSAVMFGSTTTCGCLGSGRRARQGGRHERLETRLAARQSGAAHQ